MSCLALAAGAVACSSEVADLGGKTLPVQPEGGTPRQTSDKLDLLIVLDNSISISPQQENLKAAIPDFVERLVNENPGLSDVHVGLITTSIGGHGSDSCPTSAPGEEGEAAGDNGMLIASRPRYQAARNRHPGALALESQGFVNWIGRDPAALGETVATMVEAAGWQGCNFEAPLEAMYRLLSDPAPPLTIERERCASTTSAECVHRQGINQTLLSQRAAFLRPDSVVAVALFTDENDCSIQDEKQAWVLAQPNTYVPHGSAICSTNPNDPCCYSCAAVTVPAGCDPDPTCLATPTDEERNADTLAVRCQDPKRRYGFDFLYPVARYTNALSQKTLCTSQPDLAPGEDGCMGAGDGGTPHLVENPLFAAADGPGRDPSMVYLLGVVGVPRADLLAAGGGYKSPSSLNEARAWDVILGDPHPPANAAPVSPTDALMLESSDPRTGTDGQGNPLAPPTSASFANPTNGHEFNPWVSGDFQHACSIPLLAPVDCSAMRVVPYPRPDCDCMTAVASTMDPNCQNPTTNAYDETQRYDEAYPSPRQLELLKSLGDQGVTTSLCSPNFTDASRSDYGYREAAVALSTQLKNSLR